MLVVPDAVGCDWRMMTGLSSVSRFLKRSKVLVYLTCSDINSVVPASSSHFPRNSSPKNGFRGFFSDPNLSLLLLYDDFNVERNHFRTSKARFAGSGSEAGATNIEGCSVQYAENSVREVVPRIKGGAVKDERSPLNEAMDCTYGQIDFKCSIEESWVFTFRKEDQEPLFCGATPAPSSLEELDMMGNKQNKEREYTVKIAAGFQICRVLSWLKSRGP